MASTKRKTSPVKVTQPIIKKSAKVTIKPRINEANTFVSSVPKGSAAWHEDVVEISSDSDRKEDDESEDEKDEVTSENKVHFMMGHMGGLGGVAAKVNDQSAYKSPDDKDDEADDPIFGDLVRDQGVVDVPAMLGLIQKVGVRDIVLGSGMGGDGTDSSKRSPNLASLSNLLNAALRNNDDANLEVCFGTTSDTTWVRNTVQRMDPALAGPLLQKLAARMYRRPGRAQTLIGWVQWTLITHGGALVSQPGVTRSLQELHRVLEERARGLNSLLLLKGKLDMLDAQMQLRRNQRISLGGGSSHSVNGDEKLEQRVRASDARSRFAEDEGTVAVFVEAKEEAVAAGQILVAGPTETVGRLDGEEEEDEDAEFSGEEEDSHDESTDEEEDDMEEMDNGMMENEIDFDDVDDEDEDEDEEETAGRDTIPVKLHKSTNSFSMQR